MGRDTDMTLYSPMDESEAVGQINAWCSARWDFCDPTYDRDICTRPACSCTARPWFRPLDTAAPQTDNYSGRIWVAGGRNMNYRKLLDVWGAFSWRWPARVTLVVDDEYDRQDGSLGVFHPGPGGPVLRPNRGDSIR